MDWSRIPDVLAVAALACAFWSILRNDRVSVTSNSSASGLSSGANLWLVGWCLILVHFVGFTLVGMPGVFDFLGSSIGMISLIAAGVFFMWATVPHRDEISSRWMAAVLVVSNSFYAVLASLPDSPKWAYNFAALFIGLGPLVVALASPKHIGKMLRWLSVSMQLCLGAVLLLAANSKNGNPELGLNALLFTVYMGCCIHFWYAHRRDTVGSFITITGFLAWALVFVVAPSMNYLMPKVHLENEVWNLPKYVVAVGMLLLLLEDQIARSQFLALHDDLTGLANRRLFQDRLMTAIERARRAGTSIALLQIDLNRFKLVNDTYGHHVGDMLLQRVAKRLDGRVRRSDTLARTGGDEFSLILEESTHRDDSRLVADSLVELLTVPFDLGGVMVQIGASVGVAIYPNDAEDSEALYITADLRMYREKNGQREARAFRDITAGIAQPEPQPLN